MTEKTPVVYRDFNLNFAQNPLSGDIAMLTNEKAIAQSLKNLMLTNFGEVPFSPDLGSGINSLLFEPASELLTITLKDKVMSLIRNYEPRIELMGIQINDNTANNSYEINISYRLVVSNKVFTANISLDRLQ